MPQTYLKDLEDENRKLRLALLLAAPHHQGGSSKAGKAIADALGLPFPLRMNDIADARDDLEAKTP